MLDKVGFNGTSRQRNLYESFHRFEQLNERDQRISKLVSLGESTRSIAETLEVSDKTIENRKAHILDVLGLNSTLDLVKLLVRIQDKGLADFGL